MASGDVWWADGFDSGNIYQDYGTASYGTTYSRITTDGTYGVYFAHSDAGTHYLHKTGLSSVSEFMFGFAIKVGNLTLGSGKQAYILSWKDGVTHQAGIGFTNGGTLSFFRKSSEYVSAATLASSSTQLVANTWHWVEGKCSIHSTTGYIELKINGNTVISMTTSLDSATSANNYANAIMIGRSDSDATTTAISLDDVYIVDNTGNTLSYYGDVRILDIYPSSDGYYNDWTPSTGSDNWAMIDEVGGAIDTDYVSTSTTSNQDSYGFTNLPASAVTIHNLIYLARATQADAGIRTLRFIQRQNSTLNEKTSSDTNLTLGSWTWVHYTEQTNPITTSAWTVSDLNTNSEFGIKLQA